MTTIENRMHQGTRAREILDNEAYIMAYSLIEKELIEKWKTSPQKDVEGRETLHKMLMLLSKVQTAMQVTMETGQLAMKELEHKNWLQRTKSALLP